MKKRTKAAIALLSSLIGYVSVNSYLKVTNPELFIWSDEDREEASWLATSRSWFDRKACRWMGLCGLAHLHTVPGRHHQKSRLQEPLSGKPPAWKLEWTEGNSDPSDWDDDERLLREIPQYVFEYAPLVHLYSGEQFWPCDIAEHLTHITPTLNYTPVQASWDHPTLKDLDKLNMLEHGRYVFLTSNDNVEDRPDWLLGEKNIPEKVDGNKPAEAGPDRDGRVDEDLEEAVDEDAVWFDVGVDSLREQGGDRESPSGSHLVPTETDEGEDWVDELKLRQRSTSTKASERDQQGGRSDAPAVLIVVDKGKGIVDAFWFYFYSYNLGNEVFGIRFGNHVGDWEHSLIRFHNGEPKAVFGSEHSFGEAYSYDAVEKIGKRPVLYSATGTHAMYATAGTHPYILPWGLLHDVTDRGPLWDPALNAHSYTYDYRNDTLRASNHSPKAPTEWFDFAGHWGDKFYPLGDSRQYRFAGQYHYVNGPLGPRFKSLGRRKVCEGPGDSPCVIKNFIGQSKAKRWTGVGHGEELSEEDLERFFGNHSLRGSR